MERATQRVQAPRTFNIKVIAAFATIYLVWGSTFLAIRYAVESIPPLLMIGMRSAGAGALLYGWLWRNGKDRLTWKHWRDAAGGGCCFFLLCHGSLAWAEQRVSSGLSSLILALIPIWIVVLDWLRPGGVRPDQRVLGGVLMGFGGLAVLIGPDMLTNGGSIDILGAGVLVFSALAWALGTLYSRHVATDVSPVATSAMQLLTGGGMLLIAGSAMGEWDRLLSASVTMRSALALGYLIVFGSLIAFSAFIWLLQVCSAERVSTYAYVNPVVAVLIGWMVADEKLTTLTVLAAAMIVLAVVIISKHQH
jgi:drug/metabolite transporter (DMT)-like permease